MFFETVFRRYTGCGQEIDSQVHDRQREINPDRQKDTQGEGNKDSVRLVCGGEMEMKTREVRRPNEDETRRSHPVPGPPNFPFSSPLGFQTY